MRLPFSYHRLPPVPWSALSRQPQGLHPQQVHHRVLRLDQAAGHVGDRARELRRVQQHVLELLALREAEIVALEERAGDLDQWVVFFQVIGLAAGAVPCNASHAALARRYDRNNRHGRPERNGCKWRKAGSFSST